MPTKSALFPSLEVYIFLSIRVSIVYPFLVCTYISSIYVYNYTCISIIEIINKL